MSAAIRVVVAAAGTIVRRQVAAALQRQGLAASGVALAQLESALRASAVDVAVVFTDRDASAATVIADIMSSRPVPILAVASPDGTEAAIQALAAGALEVIPWTGIEDGDAAFHAALATSARLVAGLALVKRRRAKTAEARPVTRGAAPRLVAVGASTGGPQAIAEILRGFGAYISCPVVIVQHMPAQFMVGFSDWLGRYTGARVAIAADRERLKPGHIYLAPGDRHLTVSSGGAAQYGSGEPVHSCRPSADVLFHSVASAYGHGAVGVLLSGMGEDGARGLLAMRRAGAITIAQDEASAVVYGMPAAAASLEAAVSILPLSRIASAVLAALVE
jgi:two-component system, chemotaxis family, protein-glutamate methylesterase/glutaminase